MDNNNTARLYDRKYATGDYSRVAVLSLADVMRTPGDGDDVIATDVFLKQRPSFEPIGRHIPLDFWAIEATDRPVQGQPIGVGDGYSAPDAIPDEFSWHFPDDILKKRFPKMSATLAGSLISKPRDQGQCGSCWAFASAGMTTDRWAIHTQTPAVDKSPSELLSCVVQDSRGCNGGYPQEAGAYIETRGLVTEECQPYSWCCDNQTPPVCDTKCNAAGKSVKFEPTVAQLKSTHGVQAPDNSAAGTIQAIKENIWMYGPAVAAFAVWSDFISAGAWKQTNGVYIKGKYGAAPQSKGGHAVCIVGWGKTNVSGIGEVPFWWVRNSWGTAWGEGGFFRMAMTNKSLGINDDCGLDVPINAGNGALFGGVTSWVFGSNDAHDVHFPNGYWKEILSDESQRERNRKHAMQISFIAGAFLLGLLFGVLIAYRKK